MNIEILKILLAFLLLTGCSSGSFKDESRGNTMKRYLHYCTYEIWDGFKESIDYNFYIFVMVNTDSFFDTNSIEIRLEELPKTDNLNKLIDLEIVKHKAKLKKAGDDAYFGEVHKNNIKIGDNPAVVISYEFNKTCKKGEEEFNFYLRRVENCYIKLKDKTIVIRGSTFTKLSKKVQLFYAC